MRRVVFVVWSSGVPGKARGDVFRRPIRQRHKPVPLRAPSSNTRPHPRSTRGQHHTTRCVALLELFRLNTPFQASQRRGVSFEKVARNTSRTLVAVSTAALPVRAAVLRSDVIKLRVGTKNAGRGIKNGNKNYI